MADTGPDTILLDLFRTNQLREQLLAASLDGLELPAEDYPFYVLIGAEGPWTPTLLAERMQMPLSTVLFRVGRLEKRAHAGRVPNPDDRRSYLVNLTADGQQLLRQARPRFRPSPGRSSSASGQSGSTSSAATSTSCAGRWSRSSALSEQRDRLDVRRVREHVHRPRALERVAPLGRQFLHVRGQRRRVAGDVDDLRGLEPREPA